ncbi:hypothetical protein QR680_009592 [Steinernema hermaphroditum]|uniref:Transmembrane protein 107 n=1 Tax=Steinernema hermaphroditum TaxID=289476 RepID=A0AA39IKW9_9BILA|nr:hypothetical protein QR680_009592 [Steinernema hermaphroditum]
MEVMTSNIITLVAHTSVIFCVFWNKDEHVASSVPPDSENEEILQQLDASLTVNLTLSIVLIAIETFFTLRHIPSKVMGTITLVCHALACLFLLKVVVDVHPVSHLWMLTSLSSGVPVTLHLASFALSFNKNRFC